MADVGQDFAEVPARARAVDVQLAFQLGDDHEQEVTAPAAVLRGPHALWGSRMLHMPLTSGEW